MVGLCNRGFLSGADRGRPRVDWRDLETYSEGVIALTGMPGGGGILSAAIEHSANPVEPIERYGLTRRLMDLYPAGSIWSSPFTPTPPRSWSIAG